MIAGILAGCNSDDKDRDAKEDAEDNGIQVNKRTGALVLLF